MATFLHVPTGESVYLRARSVVGRGRRAHVRSTSRRCSGEHALITYAPDGNAAGWTVRDLGSRNGTFLDGQVLPAGGRAQLKVGSEVCFGDEEEVWRLTSDREPVALATDGTVWVEGEIDLLGLPDLEDPQVIVERTPRGWFVGDEPVQDLHTVEVDGTTWTLHLSEELPATAEAGKLTLEQCGLRFAVSSDEEYVIVYPRLPDRELELAPRAHHELLLLLARQRLQDAADVDTPEAEHGWMYSTEVQKAVRASSNQVYVSIHRIRKEFAALGIVDGHDIVERRRTTRQVRIAIRDLTVQPLG